MVLCSRLIVGEFIHYIWYKPALCVNRRTLHHSLSKGIGMGAMAVVNGEVARTSTREKRSRSFAGIMAMRQIGVTIGTYLISWGLAMWQ